MRFIFPFLVNVYASGNVILQGTGSILIPFNFDYFLFKCALFIHLPSSISEGVVRRVLLQWWKQGDVSYLREEVNSKMV